jgi:hypothetical protein
MAHNSKKNKSSNFMNNIGSTRRLRLRMYGNDQGLVNFSVCNPCWKTECFHRQEQMVYSFKTKIQVNTSNYHIVLPHLCLHVENKLIFGDGSSQEAASVTVSDTGRSIVSKYRLSCLHQKFFTHVV